MLFLVSIFFFFCMFDITVGHCDSDICIVIPNTKFRLLNFNRIYLKNIKQEQKILIIEFMQWPMTQENVVGSKCKGLWVPPVNESSFFRRILINLLIMSHRLIRICQIYINKKLRDVIVIGNVRMKGL